MSDKKITEEQLGILKSIDSLKEVENLDEESKEALKAIEAAGQIVNMIMDGKRVDLSYFKIYSQEQLKNFRLIRKRRSLKGKQ